MNILYISYDGILEPIGRSQVVKYLVRFPPAYRHTVISFEKPADLRQRHKVRELEETLRASGIRWIPKRYHKWPPVLSTVFDALAGIQAGLLVSLTQGVHLIHARGYVASLITLAVRRVSGAKYLFDMRGFLADEKADGGHWSRDSWIYAMSKRCEKPFYETSDAIVSLTHEGVKAIAELGYRIPPETPIRVITTCADLDTFCPGPKDPALIERLGLTGHRVVGCVGNMGGWYLRRAMLDYLAFLTKRLDDVKILVVTAEDHERLRQDAADAGISPDRLVLTRADFAAMPAHIRLMDLGVFFIKVSFSKRGSAATKLGEFLGCGVPVVINDGVGDSGWIVRGGRAGVVLPDVTEASFESSFQAVRELLGDEAAAARCRETAKRHFDLEEGVRAYVALYRELAGGRDVGEEGTE